MKRDIPVLNITIQIPMLPDVDVEGVLEAVSETLNEALEQLRQTSPGEEDDTLTETALQEREEPYSPESNNDLLSAMGYTGEA